MGVVDRLNAQAARPIDNILEVIQKEQLNNMLAAIARIPEAQRRLTALREQFQQTQNPKEKALLLATIKDLATLVTRIEADLFQLPLQLNLLASVTKPK